MQNPASPPAFRRTCPSCNRPVEPGYKFCESCGTPIPELSTCSKCGTQFIAPEKYCDLCGAPLIRGDVQGPHDSPEYAEEGESGPVEDQVPEQYTEEIPEQDTDELPDDNEEIIVPDEDETPHPVNGEIPEPDTDELLEQFGAEYADDETLESFHNPKSRSPIKPGAKKPFMVPAPRGEVSSETIDDALFFSPKKPGAPAKPQVNRTTIIGGSVVLIVLIAAVYFIGLPILTGSGALSVPDNPSAAVHTPLPDPAGVGIAPQAPTETPTMIPRALVTQPTQMVPSGQTFYFLVQKNPVTTRISVIFTGSAGEGSIKSADIKVTHPDGSVSTGIIQPLKGVNDIMLAGSKETDRVEIIAQMYSGETYRVYDKLVPL